LRAARELNVRPESSHYIAIRYNKTGVIPAKAGIQKRVRAPYDSYARYRERWIPAFAGMTPMGCFS
jgi:IS4 transposase